MDGAPLPSIEKLTGATSKEDAIKQLAQSAGRTEGTFLNQLLSNPFFTAGFGLAGLGAAVRYGTLGLRRGGELLKRRLLVDLEVTRHDESYDWILNWMTVRFQDQMDPGKRRGAINKLIHRFTPGLHHLQIQTARSKTASGSEQTAFALVPGHGRHIIRYGNAFIAVNRERIGKSFDASGRPFETVRMTTLYHFRHIFEDIFREAYDMASQRIEGKTIVYTSRNVGWDTTGQPKRRRPFKSVVLEQGLATTVLSDVKEFLNAREWYLDRGIPYRRGYLLYGPPGTGKTSFVQALAGELDFNIAMLSLSQRGLTDDLLNHLLLSVPQRTIVLLEDIDAAFVNRRQRDEDGYSGATVTFSGLLNALDGVASAEERVIFMTTNHKDQLDPALIRPGRVDMSVHLGNATAWQIEKLWDRFYAERDADASFRAQFLQRARELKLVDEVSTASLQGLFLYNKDRPEGAIAMIEELVPYRSQSSETNASA